MRIISIASASIRGGATLSLLNLLKGLKKYGYEIMVITPEKGFLCEELKKLNIPYHIVPIGFSIWPQVGNIKDILKYAPRLIRTWISSMVSYRRIKKLAKDWKPNLIHTNVSIINTGYQVAHKLGLPHVWHIREYGDKDFSLHRFPSDKVFKKRLSQGGYAISITQDLFDYFSLSSKGRVIYNGIEGDYTNLEKKIIKDKFIYVGHISEGKGVVSLINAFSEFAKIDNKYNLELWGHCQEEYKNVIKKLICDLEMTDRILLKGVTTRVYDKMREAKAIIVPSKFEAFGRITAEAMINNCLVIGRDTGGTKEQFDNGLKLFGKEIGVRFKSDSEIVKSLKYVAEISNELYMEMLKQAHCVAATLYNVNQNIENTHKFFIEIETNKNND